MNHVKSDPPVLQICEEAAAFLLRAPRSLSAGAADVPGESLQRGPESGGRRPAAREHTDNEVSQGNGGKGRPGSSSYRGSVGR